MVIAFESNYWLYKRIVRLYFMLYTHYVLYDL